MECSATLHCVSDTEEGAINMWHLSFPEKSASPSWGKPIATSEEAHKDIRRMFPRGPSFDKKFEFSGFKKETLGYYYW
jgi:hypothetical protein